MERKRTVESSVIRLISHSRVRSTRAARAGFRNRQTALLNAKIGAIKSVGMLKRKEE